MARKFQCSAQIPGLTFILLLAFSTFLFAAAKEKQKAAVGHFDRELKLKAGALDSVKAELQKGRAKLKELEKEEGSSLAKVDQLEKNIRASQTYLKMLSVHIATVEETIATLGDSLQVAQQRLRDRQSVMQRRLRQAYMMGQPESAILTAFSGNPIDILNRVRYIQDLNRYDRELAQKIDSTKAGIARAKGVQEAEHEKLALLLDTKKKEQTELVKEESSRRAMLDDVRTRKAAYQRMVAELESAQKELNAMIKLLEKNRKKAKLDVEKKSAVAFEKRKGKLLWPIDGEIIARYGKVVHPVYKTVTMNHGIDIEPRSEREVLCVAKGTVIHVGYMRGLGKIAIVDHAGGYLTIYAQLDEILVTANQAIEAGALLGRIGESGLSGRARLHFEIRKSSDALDPAEWLMKDL